MNTRKVVINRCYGGFGLSREAITTYVKRKYNKNVVFERDIVDLLDRSYVDGKRFIVYDIERDDPVLVEVVEELGDSANGPFAALGVVEIPADIEWVIDEYDGVEKVVEKHRSWF